MAGSPIALGYRPDTLVDIARRHAHVRDIDMVVELKTGELITSKSFNAAYGHLLKNPYSSFIKWKRSPKVARIDYLPGDRDLFVHTDTGVALNTWLPGEIVPELGAHGTIDQLMHELFPVSPEREHMLTLLAFVLQRPGQKINHMVVMTGPQGTGKSSFAKLVSSMVGRKNARTVAGQVLAGRFWSDLYATQLLIIEEAVLSDRRDVGNRMKPLITERTDRVEAKHIREREMRSPDLIFMLSNHRQPVVLEESDRRVFAPGWGNPKRESAFFNRLNDALQSETPGFMASLLDRDISSFNPAAPPPMTDAKRAMAKDSIPEPARYLAELIEAGQGIYAKDLLMVSEVGMDLRGGGFPNMNDVRTGKLLAGAGAENLGQLPPGKCWQGQPRVWAIHNQDVWRAATRTQLGDYMRDRHGFA